VQGIETWIEVAPEKQPLDLSQDQEARHLPSKPCAPDAALFPDSYAPEAWPRDSGCARPGMKAAQASGSRRTSTPLAASARIGLAQGRALR